MISIGKKNAAFETKCRNEFPPKLGEVDVGMLHQFENRVIEIRN